MKKFVKTFGLVSIAVMALAASPASAAVVFSDNFDSAADNAVVAAGIGGSPGIYNVGNFPGWTGGQSAPTPPPLIAVWGLFNPSAYGPTAGAGYSAPSPNNVAYTGNGGGSREFIFHVVGAVIPGETYTLSVDVGDRPDVPFNFHGGPNGPTGYRITLETCTGPGVCFAPFLDVVNPAPLTVGAFTPVSVTGTAGPQNGFLVVVLGSGGYPNDVNQINWDNVVLNAVPELSTWAMMLIGFAGIGFVAYRRANKNAAALNKA
jgi:hypothetical protein